MWWDMKLLPPGDTLDQSVVVALCLKATQPQVVIDCGNQGCPALSQPAKQQLDFPANLISLTKWAVGAVCRLWNSITRLIKILDFALGNKLNLQQIPIFRHKIERVAEERNAVKSLHHRLWESFYNLKKIWQNCKYQNVFRTSSQTQKWPHQQRAITRNTKTFDKFTSSNVFLIF